MKFNLAVKEEATQAFTYLTSLLALDAMAEVKKVSPKRSLNQNNYLHLLLGAFGAHFGYTLAEAKQIYKQINKSIYYYDLKGREFVRSSADLDTAEMTRTIDKFREVSAAQGCDLPLATDADWLRQIENEMERTKIYE